MSYWVEDTNGYVGDIASNFGMQYLRTHGPMALQHLLENGGCADQAALDVVVQACKNSTDVEAQKAGELLAKAQAPMMVTDGTEPDDTVQNEEAEHTPGHHFNPNHDPGDGEFSSGGSGGSSSGGSSSGGSSSESVTGQTNLDKARSQELGDLVGAQNTQCYYNSALAVMHEPGAVYVEGYAVSPDLPIVMAHGWIERSNGTIIDPTPVWHAKSGTAYFAVKRYTQKQVMQRSARKGAVVPFDKAMRIGVINEKAMPAYRAAWEHAVGKEMATKLFFHNKKAGNFSMIRMLLARSALSVIKVQLEDQFSAEDAKQLLANVDEAQLEALISYKSKISASKLRQAAQFNPNHDPGNGEFSSGGGGPAVEGGGGTGGTGDSMLGKPASAYPPAHPDGIDTMTRYKQADGTYTPERAKLHDEMIAQRFKGAHPVINPTVTVMGGGPASGKSVLAHQEGLGGGNSVVADPDSFKEQMPEFLDGVRAGNSESGTFVHEESAELAKRVVREGIAGGYNVVVDGSGDNSYLNLKGKVAGYRSQGHKVVAHYVTVDTDTAVARAKARGDITGRYVPESYLRETHASVSNVVHQAIKSGLFDELTVWDTNSGKAKKIASAKGSELTIHDKTAWKKFLAKGKK